MGPIRNCQQRDNHSAFRATAQESRANFVFPSKPVVPNFVGGTEQLKFQLSISWNLRNWKRTIFSKHTFWFVNAQNEPCIERTPNTWDRLAEHLGFDRNLG